MIEESRALELARARGFLFSQGRAARMARLESAWRMFCWENGQPFVNCWKGYSYRPRRLFGHLEIELSGDWWLTRRLWEVLKKKFSEAGYINHRGNRVTLSEIPHRELETTAFSIVESLNSNRPSPEEAFDLPPRLVRGLARCVWAEAMEHVMVEGDSYYIREIPNALGHVLALRNDAPPLVGVHLERFELTE